MTLIFYHYSNKHYCNISELPPILYLSTSNEKYSWDTWIIKHRHGIQYKYCYKIYLSHNVKLLKVADGDFFIPSINDLKVEKFHGLLFVKETGYEHIDVVKLWSHDCIIDLLETDNLLGYSL